RRVLFRSKGIDEVVFSVPSGNFGNLTAGLLAARMGLPVKKFIAATNANDVVPRFLQGDPYETRLAIATLSNAMDVGNPSNWDRIMELFDGDIDRLKQQLVAYSYSDQETTEAVNEVFAKSGYVLCPHTAIAWRAGQAFKAENPDRYVVVSLSTAHACKFPDVFKEDVRNAIEIPESVNELKNKKQEKVKLSTSYDAFKAFLLSYVD